MPPHRKARKLDGMTSIPLDRVGIDVGRKLKLEDAVAWAAQHGVSVIDIQLDTGANVVTSFDRSRAHAIRRSCDRHGIRLGLHTLSAVNVAEYAPFVAGAVDAYREALAGATDPSDRSRLRARLARAATVGNDLDTDLGSDRRRAGSADCDRQRLDANHRRERRDLVPKNAGARRVL